MGALAPHSTGSLGDTLRRLNEAAGAEGVERAMRLMEARFGKMKKDEKDLEIDAKLWVGALGKFDLETLKRAAVEACSKFKFWPSLAEFKTLCVGERKDLADRVGYKPPPPRFTAPDEDRTAQERNRRANEFLALRSKLIRDAGEPQIDWMKNHKAEFARIQPFHDQAVAILGHDGK